LQLAEESHVARLNDMEGMLAEMEQKLDIAEQHATESAAALRLKEAKLGEELRVKSKELVDSDARFSAIEKSLKSKEAEFAGEISKNNLELEETRKQLFTIESDSNKKVAELNLARVSMVTELEHNRSQMEELSHQHDTIVKNLHEQHSRTLEDNRKRHAEEIEHLLSEMRELSMRASEGHAAELEHLRTQMEDAARMAALQHTKLIDNIQQVHAQVLDTARRDSDTRTRDLVDNHNEELTRLKADHKAALDKERETADRLREEVESTFRQENAKRALEDDERHRTAIEQLQSQICHREEEYENRIQRMEIEVQERIQAIEDEHRVTAKRKNEEHQAVLANLTAEHLAARNTAESNLSIRLNEVEANHAHALEKLRNDNQRALKEASDDHDRVIAALNLTFKTDQEASAKENEMKLEKLRSNHAVEMAGLRNSAESNSQQAKYDHKEQIERERQMSRDQMARQLEDMRSDHGAEIARLQDAHQVSAAEAKEEFERLVSSLSAEHQKEFDDVRKQNAVEIASLKSNHAKVIEGTQAEKRAALERAEARTKEMQDSHTARLDELQKNYQDQLQASLQTHDLLLQQQNEARRGEIEELHERHNTVLSDLRSEHKQRLNEVETTWNRRVEEIFQSHKAETQRVIETSSHEDSKAREAHELALADRDATLKTLETDLEQARLSHKNEIEQVYKQQHDARIELEQQLQETREKFAHNLSKESSMRQEISSLRTRLDAELTGHAEAERAMAEMRRQKLEEASSKEELHNQIAALQDKLKRIEEKSGDGEELTADEDQRPSKVTEIVTESSHSDDLVALKQQLTAAEQDRKEARGLFQQKLSETTELSRQNEFLVRELESLMAQLSTPKSPALNRTDAEVQTDSPRSRKQSKSQSARGPIDSVVESNNDPQSSSIYDPSNVRVEQKADMSTLWVTKGKPTNSSRPAEATRTLNGPFVANVEDGSGRASKARSFEDYLQTAQQELSELGSVISKNEALFAQKIQEHVGELQRAKNQLAADYKQEFDALIAQREKLDRDAQYKGEPHFLVFRLRL